MGSDGHRDGNPFRDRDAYLDPDGNSAAIPYGHRYADPHIYPERYAHENTDEYCIGDPIAYAHTDEDMDGDRDIDPYSHGNTHPYAVVVLCSG